MAETVDLVNNIYTGTGSSNAFNVATLAPEEQTESWTIIGLGGSDNLMGGMGDDVIDGGTGADTMNGGGGNDTFLVGLKGNFDTFVGGDTEYVGSEGIDVIKAQQANTLIGIAGITGIEEISADGYNRVTILLANNNVSTSGAIYDLSGVAFTGLSEAWFDGTSFFTPGNFHAQIQGSTNAETIIGSLNSRNFIDGGKGADIIVGGNLDDVFYFGQNYKLVSINGGTGSNVLQAYENGASITVTDANPLVNVQTISAERINDGFAPGPIFYFDVTIDGTDANDTMTFTNITLKRISKIDAGQGDDTVYGSIGNDSIDGDVGLDTLYGGEGNDTLDGGGDNDFLYGGNGKDSFYISGGQDFFYGGADYDSIVVTAKNQTLSLDKNILKSIDAIDNSSGYENFRIGAANSEGSIIDLRSIFVGPGYVSGIYGSGATDSIYGSSTYDYIYGGGGDDMIWGGGSYDYETSLGTGDQIYGGGGNDTVYGGVSYDTLYGGAGEDILSGGSHDDKLFGDNGNDTLYGDGGSDILAGGTGDDIFDAKGGGFDTYYGEEKTSVTDNGFDVIKVSGASLNIQSEFHAIGTPAVNAVNGIDRIQWDGVKQFKITLADSFSGNMIDLTNTVLVGNKGITGGSSVDVITGSAGDDLIDGKEGADVLNGGGGNDTISGDKGNDTLTGGAGNDTFTDTVVNWVGSTITDFSVGDRIVLENIKSADLVGLITYTDDGSGTAGTLSILGGGALKNGLSINLIGTYETDDFQAINDPVKGVDIVLV